ncbi:MAG TPA: 23S rRNA (adenine(2503)-C(2))-methyltransferase RlmN [Polyangiaceae bacterium]|nr:23S rRNA (adenine(2503)-C(2))-methyltransferase RlmN [Polyangiaceae bacterium]
MRSEPSTHPVARTPDEWREALAALGARAFRAREVFQWIHKRGVLEPSAMTSLDASLRAKIFEGAESVGAVEHVHRSSDDTRKAVLSMKDGARIETVLIPRVSGPKKFEGGLPGRSTGAEDDDEPDADVAAIDEPDDEPELAGQKTRVTQCISTQVGCAMGCVFCASGVAGLKRHLGAEEIVGQILLGRTLLDEGEELRNVVFMGMGEPLHNYAATKRALELMTHPEGIGLSKRRVTVSTSGLVPEIDRLGEDFAGQIGLAISLHAADDETRGALMPINKKYPLAELVAALRRYPLPKRRRITIEYTLVLGKNDDRAEAKKLATLLRGIPVKINLIPMNPIELSSLGPPDGARVEAFQSVLIEAGYSCFVRRRRGDDVAAACGQLALSGAKPKVRSLLRRS